MEINKYIDHTILKADATYDDVKKICQEAIEYNFASVCINPFWVSKVKELLDGSEVKVCTVIGFPLGANTTEVKGYETKKAVLDGADEVDMVINIGLLKDKKYDELLNDINTVVQNADSKVVKVIVETALLTDEEKVKICNLVLESKADFIKTSTGFSTAGAQVEDIELFKSIVKDELLIKASGGIKSKEDALAMINAGANRLGASSGVEIMKNQESNNNY